MLKKLKPSGKPESTDAAGKTRTKMNDSLEARHFDTKEVCTLSLCYDVMRVVWVATD